MQAPVSIAVVGAGLIGRRHAAHIRAESTVRLHAIVDPAPSAQAFATTSGVPWYPDIAAMLAAGRPDGLLIATPNQLHVANGMEAVRASIPALIEKPIADDIAAATALVEAAEAAGVPLLTGHHRRHNPMIQRARRIIAEGRLGHIVSVHGFFWLMKPDDYFTAEWRRQPGAGPLLVNLIHDVDLLRYLCGEIVSVQAYQSNAVRGHPVDETTVVIVRFAGGALGTLNVSDTIAAPWSWEHTTGENPVYPHADQICYHIGGTRGSLAVPRLELWTHETQPHWWQPFRVERIVAADEDPLRLQIRQFAQVIRGEEPPLVSGREGLRTLQVIDAIQRSASTALALSIS